MCECFSEVYTWNFHSSIIFYQASCCLCEFPMGYWDTGVLDVGYRYRNVKKQELLEGLVLITQVTWEKKFNLQLKQWILGTRRKETGFSFGLIN